MSKTEEEASTNSRRKLWRNIKEKPTYNKPFAIITSNGVLSSPYYLFENKGTWEMFKALEVIKKWCYTEDLINL